MLPFYWLLLPPVPVQLSTATHQLPFFPQRDIGQNFPIVAHRLTGCHCRPDETWLTALSRFLRMLWSCRVSPGIAQPSTRWGSPQRGLVNFLNKPVPARQRSILSTMPSGHAGLGSGEIQTFAANAPHKGTIPAI